MTAMTRPSVGDVAAYAAEMGYERLDAQAFVDYYEACGWVVGRTCKPMRSWQASVRQWQRRTREWARERGERMAGDERAVREYAVQLRRLRAGEWSMEAEGRFAVKVQDAIGREGWQAVRAMA